MTKYLILFLSLLSISVTMAGDSLTGGYRKRIEDNSDGSNRQRDQLSIDLKFNKELSEKSCLSLGGRLNSGGSFSSTYSDTENFAQDIRIRNLYLDFKCLREKTQLQIGALQTESISPTDLDKAGWLDGLRIKIDTQKYIDQFSIEAGSVNQYKETDAFLRMSQDVLNFIRVKIHKQLSKDIKSTLALTQFNDDYITQVVLDISMQEITPFLDSVKLFSTTKNDHFADAGIVGKKSLYGVDIKAGYIKVKEDLFPSSGFNSKGEDNLFISVSKTYKKRLKLELRVRRSELQTRYEARMQYKF